MKRSRFSDEQIIAIVKEQEAGAKTADVCRKQTRILQNAIVACIGDHLEQPLNAEPANGSHDAELRDVVSVA